ncbi:MAG: hypothetical protein WD342_08835 [Verrucomicrobiales bacterium]
MTSRTLTVIATCFAGLLSLPAEGGPVSLDAVNDAAAFLAGMELPHRKDHPLARISSWEYHVKQMDNEFGGHQERVLFPMTKWSAEEIRSADGSEDAQALVRYMFSGPDLLHVYHMFPQAETYVLCGLEPVGELPAISMLDSGNAERALAEVRNALGEAINFSFFRTADMKDDLKFAVFRGATPIMSIFLARSGQYIKDLEFFVLEKDGTLTGQGLESSGADAVKIVFSPRRLERTKTLYYFSSNLHDSGFGKTGFRTWLEAQPDGHAYLKAASFLMHGSGFTQIRQHLLDRSFQIIQDDSGIPYRHFDGTVWYGDLYGNYTGPIDLFAERYQGDLRGAYRKRSKPLPFGTGYKWRKGESNLMRFLKQDHVAATAESDDADESDTAPEGEGSVGESEDPVEADVGDPVNDPSETR